MFHSPLPLDRPTGRNAAAASAPPRAISRADSIRKVASIARRAFWDNGTMSELVMNENEKQNGEAADDQTAFSFGPGLCFPGAPVPEVVEIESIGGIHGHLPAL